MTLPELLGGIGGTLAAGLFSYRLVMSKIDSVIGKKGAPGDSSLRDLVMKIDGKIDAHHETNAEQFRALDKRLDLVEQRVFTPPQRVAIRAVGLKSE